LLSELGHQRADFAGVEIWKGHFLRQTFILYCRGPAERYSAEHQSYGLIWFSCRDPKLAFRNEAIRPDLNQSVRWFPNDWPMVRTLPFECKKALL
jgi:hypothetical protein